MGAPAFPADEGPRLAALRTLRLLDTPPEERFDRILRLARAVFGVPMGALSLVDSNRQFFKSSFGIDATEAPRDVSFCGHAILDDDGLCVPDATSDPRFRDNPFVTGEPGIRFYAGVTLKAHGRAVGTLCIVDRKPRHLAPEELSSLRDLARLVEEQLAFDPIVDLVRRHSDEIKQRQRYELQLVERQRRLELLLQTATAVPRSATRAETISRTLEPIARAFPGVRVAYVTIDRSGRVCRDHELVPRGCLPAAVATVDVDLLDGMSPDDAPLVSGNLDADPDRAEIGRQIVGRDARALLVLPVDHGDGLKALLTLASPMPRPWPPSELEAMQAVAAQLARAMREARNEEERRTVETQLRTQTSRLTALLDSMQSAILVEDDARRIVHANASFCAMFGLPDASTVTGADCALALLHHAPLFGEGTPLLARIDQLLAAREVCVGEQISLVDGRTIARDYVPIFVDGAYRGHLWHYRDISAFKRTEAELEVARNKALELAATKADFLATMSHEIRTPMNGVLGLLCLLDDGRLDDEQRYLAGSARRAAESLMTILNDVLDFSRIDADKLAIEAMAFDLRGAIREVAELHVVAAKAKGLSLTVSCSDDLPPSIVGDPTRFRQVLGNLVGNAVKFTAAGGVQINVGRSTRGDRLEVEVADTGLGLTADQIGRLFERFSQAEASTARRFGGSGLGLAITKRLLLLMKGDISVRSELGSGSSFRFWLPFGHAATPVETPAVEADVRDRLRGRRILVVDDNAVNHFVARGLLRKLGCDEVVVAENGREALERIAQQPFDLVLMDCQMPDMDGFEATRRLRALEVGGLRTPIIAMSAGVLEGERSRCAEEGMDDFMAKPFGTALLAQMLTRHLRP